MMTNTPRILFNIRTYFTGLLGCHKLVLSVFKTSFSKAGPKERTYKDFKNFH